MSPRLTDRLARVRDRAATVNEHSREQEERERRLPEALCAACGAIVGAGEGSRERVGTWAPLDNRVEWSRNDAERIKRGLAPFDEWRRRHDECETSPQIVAQITGTEGLSPLVAGTALTSLAEPLLARLRDSDAVHAYSSHKEPRPRRWAWVGDAERAALRRAVEKVRATIEPRRCQEGACAWCGVSTSIGWRSSPERWSDGTAAPLCTACASVWDDRGNPQDRDGLRSAALQALSGAASMTNASLGLRCYVDVTRGDHSGTADRWTYAPEALADLTEEARMAWPALLPIGLQEIYREKSARAKRDAWAALAADRDAAERKQAEAEVESARAAGWPI